MSKQKVTIILVCLILVVSVFALKMRFQEKKIRQNVGNAQMANPASAFCVNHGGKIEIKTDANGGQHGNCVFAGGEVCDEWAYFRGECNAG